MANLFPTAPDGWDSTDGPINLGTKFTVSAAKKITAGRYYKNSAANNGLVVTMSLYAGGNTPVATATRTQLSTDPIGWVTVPFTTPFDVVTGVTYTMAWRTTGTSYYVTSTYPLTATTVGTFGLPANHAVYGYGALAKPIEVGGYSYAIDAVDDAGTTVITAPAAVKALDTDQDDIPESWFAARAAEGVKLFITAGTPWSEVGDVTVNTPRLIIREQFRLALKYGMKIALYTRNPDHYNTGLDAAGPYISALQFFAVDVEPDPGKPVTQAHIDGVLARGVRPVVYAGSGFWADIQGSTSMSFSQYPLWDTDARETFSYVQWQNGAATSLVQPPPVAYGGWNGVNYSNLRIGVQQLFDYMLGGVKVDLNSFNAAFLVEKDPVVVPEEPAPDEGGPANWWTDAEVASAKARGKNLVRNGDMELGAQVWPANSAVTYVAAAARNGSLGMRVTKPDSIVYLLNDVVATRPGQKFYAEMWVRRPAGTDLETYGGLGFVAQTNNGAGVYNTPTIVAGLAQGEEGQYTSGQIPTSTHVKLAAIITASQAGAVQISFAPWIYNTPNTYDIDDIFVAAMDEQNPVQARLKVMGVKVVSVPQKHLKVFGATVAAVPRAMSRIRVISLRTIARVTPYAIRKNGKWAQIETKIYRSGKWG